MRHAFRSTVLGMFAGLLALPAVAADARAAHAARAGNAYVQLVADVTAGTRAADNSCYAICRYEDTTGTEFTGTSEQGCGQACVEAGDKCDKQGEGDCTKVSCESPNNCDTPQ